MRSMRFVTRQIQVGSLKLGGSEPILVQSMTTTDTMDVEATTKQVMALANAGCDIARITAPTINDAEALGVIRARLTELGCDLPLVADIHFLPKAAMIAADFVDKVRINPGNFADRKMGKIQEYSDLEYGEELQRIEDKFIPLVEKLKAKGRALRIGTNHGSLSDRIMNRFGDTPEGMVESAFEYASICRKLDFHNFCFSMKASNVRVMIETYRLLVDRQQQLGWDYPIHLGVTEAGDGEDGRIKSFIGIGTLLAEGIGDTIRVSLTESPLHEVPVGRLLANRFPRGLEPMPREYRLPDRVELNSSLLPEVWLDFGDLQDEGAELRRNKLLPDVLYVSDISLLTESIEKFKSRWKFLLRHMDLKIAINCSERQKLEFEDRKSVDYWVGEFAHNGMGEDRVLFNSVESLKLAKNLDPNRAVVFAELDPANSEIQNVLDASLKLGTAFVDLPLAGSMIKGLAPADSLRLNFGILQATRRRMSKTEYIACPSCGRTLFNLEETTARIRKLTSHLKGVKLAIMGCIVNGPGEMADADFGYVGGAPGRVNLYVQKDCVERNIPAEEAPAKLIELIKSNGRWVEPEIDDLDTGDSMEVSA
ncbi:MAG: 4-hydroxy-3-methylbut-2-en-1-yl diphosphate synthase [Deltaproteobacteria bacterium CG11_big_fil_rev_8_21_14_0_20_45_16]|nr:MAG: 4-hydroxy-3-methylbut-2-en-1-yl diphosphate synthase [Deltaproteobacteria bacterium CG11_big_fil_rev_8_21_14_0_20_45_16]